MTRALNREKTNPWGLTPRQVASIEAVMQTGCHKGAARLLGISHKTVEANMTAVKEKIGGRNRLASLIAWDRWARGTPATGADQQQVAGFAAHEEAMKVLRQIAGMPGRSRGQRLASACVQFLDAMVAHADGAPIIERGYQVRR